MKKLQKSIEKFNTELRDHFLQRTLHFISAASIFFTCATLLAFALYGIGNFQRFTATSQIMLLNICQFMGIIAAVISVYLLIFLIYWGITRKEFPLQRMVSALLIFTINTVLAIISILIQDLTQGI